MVLMKQKVMDSEVNSDGLLRKGEKIDFINSKRVY